MNLEKIEKLVKIIENSSMLDFSIQEGDVKIKMSRRGSAGAPSTPMAVSTQGVDNAADGLDSDDEGYITSPIVGTFYSAPSPEAKAFVKVGDRVKAGQTSGPYRRRNNDLDAPRFISLIFLFIGYGTNL